MPYIGNRGKFTYGLKTIAQIDAITGMQAGDTVYDTTNNRPTRYTGSVWTNADCIVLTNRSGVTLVRGDLVIVSPNANAIRRTTTSGNPLVVGPIVYGGADLSEVAVAISGIYDVNLTAAGTARDGVITGTTLGRGRGTNNFAQDGVFANILNTGAGAGLHRCFIRPHAEMF